MSALARSVLLTILAAAFLAQSSLIVWLMTARAEQQVMVDTGILLAIRKGHEKMEATFKDKCSVEGNNLVDAIGTVRAQLVIATGLMAQCAQVSTELTASTNAVRDLETKVDGLSRSQRSTVEDLTRHIDQATEGMALETSLQRVLTALVCDGEDACFDGLVRVEAGLEVLQALGNPSVDTPLVKALGTRLDAAGTSLQSATTALQQAVDASALIRTQLQALNEDDARPKARLGNNELTVHFPPPKLLACEDVEVAAGIMSAAGNKPTYPVTLSGGTEAVNMTEAAIGDLEGITGITMRRHAARVGDACVAVFSLGPNARTWFGQKKAEGRALWVQMALVSRGAHRVTPIE